MQLLSARTASHTKSRPVNAFNPSGRIRRGFMGCQASSQSITSILEVTNDHLLQRHAQVLTIAVRVGLRDTAQLAISHPTPATLKDAFDSVDRVQAACQSVRRRILSSGAADVRLLEIMTQLVATERALDAVRELIRRDS